MAGRADAGAAMDVDADVTLGSDGGLAGVDAHAHLHGACGERPLRGVRRGHRVARPRKCDEERVALGVNLDPAVLGHGAAQGAAVGGEDLGIALTQVVNEPRRSLDVGE